jgi:hypothetical protein
MGWVSLVIRVVKGLAWLRPELGATLFFSNSRASLENLLINRWLERLPGIAPGEKPGKTSLAGDSNFTRIEE